MVIIRGINVFPSVVEEVIRSLTAAEFRIVATRRGESYRRAVGGAGGR